MANKKVEIMIDDVRLVAELYVDDAPIICNMILNNPGQRAIIQHAKLNGQLFFGTLPYACGFENQMCIRDSIWQAMRWQESVRYLP